jgi:hypothetical protein
LQYKAEHMTSEGVHMQQWARRSGRLPQHALMTPNRYALR